VSERESEEEALQTLCTRSLPSARDLALGKVFLILKYTLPSARSLALGKAVFAECLPGDTRQGLFPYSLPSATQLALDKAVFAECLRYTLGKVFFYFFYFVSQTFCGMFLHYVDLHVSFVDNYNRVPIVSRFSSFI
jgi:hypothetical protein